MRKKLQKAFVSSLVLSLGLSLTACGSSASSSASASGEWKPTKDVNVIVAYKAGSGTDTGARILCASAEKYVGETMVIVNKEGADGKIGWTELTTSKPDGQTIGFVNMPTYASLSLEKGSPFGRDDITPICNQLSEPACIVVRNDSQFKTIEDLVKYCKENPGKIKCSTNGEKASNHIGMQLLAKAAGFEVNNTPYGGTADQLLALRQGEVDMSCAKIGDVSTLVGDDKELRLLAVYTAERLKDYPDVPTLDEKGYNIDGFKLVYGSGRGIVGPKGMPENMVKFYADKFKQAMEDPENVKKSENAGLSLVYMAPDEYSKFIDSQFQFAKDILPKLFD